MRRKDWHQVPECVAEIERDALALAQRAWGISSPELAAMAFARAKEKYALAREVEFFGDLHPYFQAWELKHQFEREQA